MSKTRLNHFLKLYKIHVADLSAMSGQSPQTIRNWFRNGENNEKSLLIVALIAAYKWREHTLTTHGLKPVFQSGKQLSTYLKPLKMELSDLTHVSGQSPQTLRNWLNASDKYLLIDILVDAVHWQRYARKRNLIHLNSTCTTIATALLEPITKAQLETNFDLDVFVKSRAAKFTRKEHK